MTIAVANTSQHTTFLTYKSSLIANGSRFFTYGLLQVMEKVKLTMLEEWPRLLSNVPFQMIFTLKPPLTWVQYLSEKFSNNLLYCFQEVDVKALEEETVEDSLNIYDTVDGSIMFQVAVSTPNSEIFKSSSSSLSV